MSETTPMQKKIMGRFRPLPRIVYPPELPIMERKEAIVQAIRRHRVVVITGETGSGKTTQIPKMCIEAGRGLRGLIGCTQPRRIAATTVARRIAEELGEEIGRSVGYKIRFDDTTPRDAAIKIMTDGILLMEAQRDPLLKAYDTIIVDEAHERSLNIDFILGILRSLLSRRRDLHLIITSATIDTQKFSQAFDDAPVIEVSGRLYPVEVRYRPLDPGLEEKGEITHVEAAVRAVDEISERRDWGDTLIFMPTEQDIREACALLTGRYREGTAILPLFSRLTTAEQQRVFRPLDRRKIVVATNVAETSITIPGIRYVIDTGLARIAQYNPRSRTAGLPVRRISRSSADQRKGRCGRVQNGICIRLYDEEDYLARPLYTAPEILRSNLAEVILRMLALNLGDIASFPFIDCPTPKSIRDGIEILLEIGAIEPEAEAQRGAAHSWRLTERGRIMARLPLDPRISRMILAAREEGCLPEIAVIAAALSIQDPRERPADKEAQADQAHARFKDPASDFSALLSLWRHAYEKGDSPKTAGGLRRLCRDQFLSYRRMREWRDIHDQILSILSEQRFLPRNADRSRRQEAPRKEGAELYAALHRSILSGFLGQIAVKKEKNLYTATQGRQAMIFPGSGLFNRGGTWIVSAEMVETSRLFARTVANIDSGWLEALGGNLCRRTYSHPRWEKDRGEVVASEQVTLFGLVIVTGRPVAFSRVDPAEAARIFVRSALVAGEVKRPFPFLTHNQSLIEKIGDMEEKVRRRDLLIGEEEMAQFYEKRLSGICDIRSLQRLIRDRGSDDFLRMTEDDLLATPPDPEEMALFPSTVTAGGWRLDCVYRFEPGKPLDGVTLKIPIHAAPSLPAQSLDWAIPGLLKEKVLALLRGLPKEYRKKLQPLAQTCDTLLEEMEHQGPLPTALGRAIFRKFGIDIPGDRWPLDGIEEHLKLRYAVVDDGDRELATGRDISILQQEFGGKRETKALAEARRIWEKSGLTAWDFGDLPERVALTAGAGGPVAFPALCASDTDVALRLFRSEREARQSHCRGVRALMALCVPQELRHLRKALSPTGDLKLWAAAFGGAKALENAVAEKVMHDLLEADCRTAAAFHAHAEAVRPQILTRGQELLRMSVPLIRALYEVSTQIKSREAAIIGNKPALAFLAGLREELTLLVPPDFLLRYRDDRIGHICRYLRGVAVRAERGAVHLDKVLTRGREVEELVEQYREIIRTLSPSASEEKIREIEEFRWLIEEYKISLFAQELKTPVPVSRKRLDAKLREIERIL